MSFVGRVELGSRFRNVLASQFGLAIEESRVEHMLDLLERRLAGSGADAEAYFARLERPEAQEELGLLARELTVAETYFFRNSAQFDALRALLLSGHGSAGNRRPQLLSAGCASGEEAYSLSILLREALPDREASIVAFDVNPWILERARRGIFSAWSLRETSPDLRARWFRPRGREFALDDSIRRSVRFTAGNLAGEDAVTAHAASFDVIFCRNVLMYFTPSKFSEAVARLARALTPGGYLFLGSAETLRGISQDFELCQSHGAFYYRKKQALGAWTEQPRRLPDRALSGANVEGPRELAAADGLHWIDSIGRASARIHALSSAPERPGPLPRPGPGAAREPRRAIPSDLSAPLELLRREQFAEALAEVRALPPHLRSEPDALLLEAVLLTSQGEWSGAETTCRRLLELDELNAGAHYVLGLCGAGADRLEQATHHQRVAIYLDPHFAMPRLQLGLLLRRKGESSEARRELTQARALLEREDARRLLMFGGGFARAALLALCNAELASTRENA
jgi:chemotaxis protein methyltransferase CheR